MKASGNPHRPRQGRAAAAYAQTWRTDCSDKPRETPGSSAPPGPVHATADRRHSEPGVASCPASPAWPQATRSAREICTVHGDQRLTLSGRTALPMLRSTRRGDWCARPSRERTSGHQPGWRTGGHPATARSAANSASDAPPKAAARPPAAAAPQAPMALLLIRPVLLQLGTMRTTKQPPTMESSVGTSLETP